LKRIINYFSTNYEKQIDEIRSAANKSQYDKVFGFAHKIKSEVGNFGAEKAVEIAKEIEKAATDKNADEIEKSICSLHEELSSVNKYLQMTLLKL